MNEKIGNVSLNLTYYSGTDLYSDGDIENELLKIAENHSEDEINSVIAASKSWPVLYHFSHIRENVVEFLPIDKNDCVLEIGAGCGAVTGALARKAGHVTCIDLSKKRSSVNAYRHKDFDNIEIYVGNFQDIEPNLPIKYDYITLIGVYEYSALYINSNAPYTDMLKLIKAHLKPEGKIVIAIENRLGLKYWAGSSEDHTGNFFEGLEGYSASKYVHTFSKKELKIIIDEVGGLKYKFYYPYPDYKFPLSIYSDDYLPKLGELKSQENNFDRQRIHLFDETKVFNSLIDNGLFTEFSNSFILLIERLDY